MQKLTIHDVKDLVEYEKVRDSFRRRIIETKARRRVTVGDRVSLVFENRETALSQVQEMVRAERIVDPEKIQFEVDTYNALIPAPGELSATLFIEITDAADIRRELDRLIGLDAPGVVWFDLGAAGRADGLFEAGHSNEERISAVHYVKFPFSPAQRAAFLQIPELFLVVDHPAYRHRASIADVTRRALAEDLAG
ncbi:MAG TPA: DUF3501 family protein [Patescibacteria group bacterium]|jgi:hypothetical protein|nr:DUF3501 family protein [Patescibacteria group bacterium]